MIKTFRLKNFKAFEDTGEIELKPITVLAGPNSGGKSSVLQSLLLLKQTFETEIPSVALNLEGRFLQFSGFEELTYGKPSLGKSEVSYQFIIETPIPGRVIHRYFPDSDPNELEDTKNYELESNVEFSFRHRPHGEDGSSVRPYGCSIKSLFKDNIGPELSIRLLGKRYITKAGGKGKFHPTPDILRKVKDVAFNHFLPSYLIQQIETDESRERELERLALDPILRSPLTNLRIELDENLKYLGPLREEPRRAYLHSGSPFPEIGKKGEYAAQILWLEKNSKVRFIKDLQQEPVESTLMEAVAEIFLSLGVIEPIDVSSTKRLMYQVLFRIGEAPFKKQVTIADVGFGMSQLLPIIVMGLRSSESSILVFEQPEIHLHPRIQSNLADFMLKLAISGKRVLVETHSDYFINRLRRRIAEDKSDNLRDKISILFVRPPLEGKGAVIEPLRVDKYGVIENWPPDFLPESGDEAEAIIRASLEKRKRQ